MATDTQTQDEEKATEDSSARRDGEGGNGGRPEDNAHPDPAELAAELDRTRKALAKSNRESAEARRFKADYEKDQAEKAQRELPEIDRLKGSLKEQEARERDLSARLESAERLVIEKEIASEVAWEALKLGFTYPQDVPKLVDRSRIDYDPEARKVTGVQDAVARLAKDRPALLTAPRGGGSPGAHQPRRPATAAPTTTPQQTIEDRMRQSPQYSF